MGTPLHFMHRASSGKKAILFCFLILNFGCQTVLHRIPVQKSTCASSWKTSWYSYHSSLKSLPCSSNREESKSCTLDKSSSPQQPNTRCLHWTSSRSHPLHKCLSLTFKEKVQMYYSPANRWLKWGCRLHSWAQGLTAVSMVYYLLSHEVSPEEAGRSSQASQAHTGATSGKQTGKMHKLRALKKVMTSSTKKNYTPNLNK